MGSEMCIRDRFLGEQLDDVITQLISTGSATHSLKGGVLQTGVASLPDLAKDATDRNRTSPFAFTGNKFEFRMVGSQDSISAPNVVLNTIVAEAFEEACDELEKACLLYTSPSPRDGLLSRMPSSA